MELGEIKTVALWEVEQSVTWFANAWRSIQMPPRGNELGVSKTAVMKKIDNLGLREKLAKNGNRLAIREPEEKLIIEAFSKKESTTANQKPPTKSTTANQKPPTKSTTAALLAAQESVKAAQALHAIDRKEDVLAIEGDQEEKDLNRKWWQFWKFGNQSGSGPAKEVLSSATHQIGISKQASLTT